MENKYTVTSLFTGIGGLDSGFGGSVIVPANAISESAFISHIREYNFVELKKKDFEIVFQNDIDKGVENVLKMNGTYHNFSNVSIYDLVNADYSFPIADVIIGGFPCQSFSHAGKRLGFENKKSHNVSDEVNSKNNSGNLYKSYVAVVRKTKPKLFVAENVLGLLTMKNALNQIMTDFASVGYMVEYQVVDCTEYGISQTRKRVIIMGIRNDFTGTLDKEWNFVTKNKNTCFLREYIQHLKEPIETDDISQKLFSKAKKLNKGQGQTAVSLDGFAPTIRSEHHGNIEFRRLFQDSRVESLGMPRRLTVREAGLIQTFPPNFKFTEKTMSGPYRWIGNAVPPLLSYLIADKVHDILQKHF